MSKIGTKELELRKMRETIADGEAAEARASKKKKLTEAHKLMLADGLPLALLRTDAPSRKPARDKSAGDPGVTLAPPLAVQKAIAADLAEGPLASALADLPQKAAEIAAKANGPAAPVGKPLTRAQAKKLVHRAQSEENSPITASEPKERIMRDRAKKEATKPTKKTAAKKLSKKPATQVRTAIKDSTKAKKTKTQKKRYDMEAARAMAAEGKLPPKPDFSAQTHHYYRKHLDAFEKLAKAGDLKGLQKYEPHFEEMPYCGSRTPLVRYRDNCIAALKVQAKK